MKRYISLALAAVVLVVSLAVPSYAAETDSLHYFELLDFSSANNGSNLCVTTNGSNIFNFEMPEFTMLSGLDVLVISSTPIDSANLVYFDRRVPLTITPLYGNYYRLSCGFFEPGLYDLSLEFNIPYSGYINFLSIKCYKSSSVTFDMPADGIISYGGGEEGYFHYSSDDDYSGQTLPGNAEWANDDFQAVITVSDFTKCDTLNLSVYLSQLDVSSITVSTVNQNIPFTYSYIDPDIGLTGCLVNLTIDCSDLAYYNEDLEVIILGTVSPLYESVCYIAILYSSGVVYSAQPNENLFFFRKLSSLLSSLFSTVSQPLIDIYLGVQQWISTHTSTIVTELGVFYSGVQTWIADFYSGVNQWISAQTSTIVTELGVFYSGVQTWLSTQTNTIVGEISVFYSGLKSWISDFYQGVKAWSLEQTNAINSWGQAIVDAINGDASDADKFQQQVDESNKELNDMAAVMDSFTTPNIDSINVDVGSFVSPSDISSLTAPMGMLFESDLVVTCMMISIIMGTVMFVLYGKR